MAGKKETTDSPDSGSPPILRVPRSEAEDQIASQIQEGRRLLGLARQFSGLADLEAAKRQYSLWDAANRVILRKVFGPSEALDEYMESHRAFLPQEKEVAVSDFGLGVYRDPFFEARNIYELAADYVDLVQKKINCLQLALGLLPLYDEPTQALPTTVGDQPPALGTDIFVVHGHDEAAKQSVARFIERGGLSAIILQEQPSGGRTIIEKFEEESSEVGFAVVLLTPDDIGAPGDKPEDTKRRARQNVIFELGYFVGKLGRDKVCVLHKGDVEIPSDYHGVIYVPMDAAEGWKLRLAKEINNAGIDFDLKKAL